MKLSIFAIFENYSIVFYKLNHLSRVSYDMCHILIEICVEIYNLNSIKEC